MTGCGDLIRTIVREHPELRDCACEAVPFGTLITWPQGEVAIHDTEVLRNRQNTSAVINLVVFRVHEIRESQKRQALLDTDH